MGLIDLPYEEQTLILPHVVGAPGQAQKLPGLWDYVQILDTDGVGNDQEVSFDGVHWTRLRKGILVRVRGGTADLQFRAAKGSAADVTISVAYGFGAITDSRLVIDAGSGIVTVTVDGAPAAGGALPVSIQSAPTSTLEDVPYANAAANGAANATTQLVSAAANVNGVKVYAGAFFMACGSPAVCLLFGAGVNTIRVGGFSTQFNAAPQFHILPLDVIVPAGKALKVTVEGSYAYAFNYKVL